MSRYMRSLLGRGQLEVLCRKTNTGDRSKVFLLGTVHRTKTSRRHATKLVNILRPDVLFLELDHDRAREIHLIPDSEFFVARRAASRLGIRDDVYGDLDYQVHMAMIERRKQELLHSSMDDVEKLKDQAVEEIELHFRDSYMVDGLLRLDKSVILGIVGRDHLKGMKECWEYKTGVLQDSLLNLSSD